MSDDVPARAEEWLRKALGEPGARAAVTFLGTERIEVLRFLAAEPGPEPGHGTGHGEGRGGERGGDPGTGRSPGRALVRYTTLGMSATPMADPSSVLADPERGPRAELILTLRAGGPARTDEVLRPLAVLAASPQVEGVVVSPGASLDLGEPLWPGAPFTSVLVGESGGLVPDLPLPPPREPVRFLPLSPMTPHEAAFKRARGAEALRERWLRHGTDLRDPVRPSVPLTG